jgi:hypothetical protein
MVKTNAILHLFRGLAAFAFMLCAALTSSASAQNSTGTIRGTVTGATREPVAEAQITARNPATGVQRGTTSRADGSYVLPGLVPATYELTARRIGTTPQTRRVVVQIGATQIQDWALVSTPAQLEAVVVAAGAVPETRTSEVATNVTQAQIDKLPTSSRNFLELAALAPGVTVSEDRRRAGKRRMPSTCSSTVRASRTTSPAAASPARTRAAGIHSPRMRSRNTASSPRTSKRNTRRRRARSSPRRLARARTSGREARSSDIRTRVWCNWTASSGTTRGLPTASAA